ncbi:two-component system sensor kinase : PAS/PAC sensor signal transduction histidine kinase OS=Burkholderia sp. (strain CCGE1002) GN=BC1002_6138 PE=4 SV=1: PAS_3: PAS: HisKA_3: HATPase_c [Gemmataceae bacterium]|nr:two-component system sensor kinase : PAS/PAC sensor signal transduction histidine kinase OS=Burkholderia sp. (strain CCGE1002) GN=BC1002_6138 PE=4 SV=1: PAS_3: PAS: HisKA_3: HATPase_c [Gemmataceae bacterium]VTT99031.1 two-component system sensor kinase : PAS/PAC sensor signal transduction histidine kinase OS=Burkholderia sp. (strain CCGE1002) GN=BC1002_6138 PE=4 SV=1: PAS_3: PAS: HisKA_3: HATPase_c [Gemmataceae bacterium]
MGIWTLDVTTGTQIRDANLNRLLGLEPRETTQPFDEFLTHISPDDVAAVREAFTTSVREGRPLNVEFRVVRPDGRVRWFRDQGDVFGASTSQSPNMAGACVDVTERREAEEALRGSEERLRLILESATDFAIFAMDRDRRVTSWSSGAEVVFGYSAAEAVGQVADMVFVPEDRAAGGPEGEAETALRTGRAADERWHLRRDGTRFWASGVMAPLLNGGGFVKVLRDLTYRKRMEDALRAAHNELEGRVAARTAELERALDALGAEMARRRDLARELATVQEDERRRVSRDLHDTVGQTLTGLGLAAAAGRADRVRELTDQLAREIHQVAIRLRPVALDDMGLDAALAELVRQWSAASGVPVDFVSPGVGRLPAPVETAVYRVAQEALTNVARHARATRAGVSVTRTPDQVSITVEDDGAGFDPGTNWAGRLGLLGMRERVAQIDGTLEIESALGRGTTVIARFPVGP